MNNEEMDEMLKKNPKLKKALLGLLEPLEQEGDSLTISADLQDKTK
jgi:hypothetical protein